jgi:hypothetical protein
VGHILEFLVDSKKNNMKELILIGAHCPDDEREKLLNECIDVLQRCRNEYDILICSHTEIPSYISKKVDYVFYDKNNDLITDLKYLNQPWFSPVDGMTILSTYIGQNSTYLAVYRLVTAGLGFAKMFKYKKVHYVEYDTIMNDLSELYDNSKLLDEYDNVVIQKEQRDYEENIAWPMGNFMSFKVDSINELFTSYDKEKLLEILFNSPSKTNEKITNDIMKMDGNTIYIKDYEQVKLKDIKFALSNNTSKETMNYWTVPFYNTKEDKVSVIVWNNKDDEPINVNFIVNNEKIITFKGVNKFGWRIGDIGNINDINSILILVNDRIKTNIKLNEENREWFKKTNYTQFN